MSDTNTRNCIVTFYHDIEQDYDSDADPQKCREFVRRLTELEKNNGARATYNVVGALQLAQPDLVEMIEAAGHEVAFHSCNHHVDWNPSHYADEVHQCRQVSKRPKGYRSPRSQWNQDTLEALWDAGFLWSAENEHRVSEPYFIHKGLVRLPILTDEWPIVQGRMDHEEWHQRFEDAVRKRPYVAIGLHDYTTVDDPDRWLASWERMLKTAASHNALMLTFSEAADLYRRASVSRHYDRTVADWNRHTGTLYRTTRFGELLSEEVDALASPAIADLASAGGVQSYPLKDRASRIYCVDNSPGMVDSVESDEVIQGQFGEMTATGLQESSMDLVFCVNAVEYLFWPEDLADEVKRIARPNARCLVAFPAAEGCPLQAPVTPPDRIQHNFTRSEVEAWASLIGPGEIVGIQHDAKEPADAAEAAEYRRLESDQENITNPMFWVFRGEVARQDYDDTRRVIPLASAPFTFRSQKLDLRQTLYVARTRIPEPVKRVARKLLGRPDKNQAA